MSPPNGDRDIPDDTESTTNLIERFGRLVDGQVAEGKLERHEGTARKAAFEVGLRAFAKRRILKLAGEAEQEALIQQQQRN